MEILQFSRERKVDTEGRGGLDVMYTEMVTGWDGE